MKTPAFVISLILSFAVLASSWLWLPWLSRLSQDGTASLRQIGRPAGQRAWHPGVPPGGTSVAALQRENEQLRRENGRLRAEQAALGLLRKEIGSDLRCLSVGVIGSFFRQYRDLLMIDAGEDLGIRNGDLLVQDHAVVGRVLDTARGSALVESLAAPLAECFVRIDGLAGEHLWRGDGGGLALVRIHEDAAGGAVGRTVWLGATDAMGGDLMLGRVKGLEDRMAGGWIYLVIETIPLEPDACLHVVQENETKDRKLFEKPDEITRLRAELARRELVRLRLEMLRR